MVASAEREGAWEESQGLVPASQASRIANRFLLCYLAGSMAWILGSDAALSLLERAAHLPLWIHSAKGAVYVFLFGIALRQAARRYVDEVERAHKAHIQAKLELVHRLARAAEYRDDETEGHNARIGRFAAVVARKMGLDSQACAALAAALHDLGKIGIPDALLQKLGPFTPHERTEMERHTELGAEILAGGYHPLVRTAHAIALTHHERWDGSGCPQGLRGDEIPLEGRIVAVCDVFDALTTARPYKEARPVAEAVAEIERGEGVHFEPAVVDAFRRCLLEIMRARAEFSALAPAERRRAA